MSTEHEIRICAAELGVHAETAKYHIQSLLGCSRRLAAKLVESGGIDRAFADNEIRKLEIGVDRIHQQLDEIVRAAKEAA